MHLPAQRIALGSLPGTGVLTAVAKGKLLNTQPGTLGETQCLVKKSDGGALQRFRTDPQVEYTQHRVCSTRMEQGALVVTEPHSELNAGLIFRSSHPLPI